MYYKKCNLMCYIMFGRLHVNYHDHKDNSYRKIEFHSIANYNVRLFGILLCFTDYIYSIMYFLLETKEKEFVFRL